MKAVFASALTLAAVFFFSGCGTLTPQSQRNLCATIERALTMPEAGTQNNPAPRDPFAAVIALRYGLNGASRDEARAAAIFAGLTTPHTRMMSYWLAGTKKVPGHMMFTPMT